jgi:diphthine synthase
MLYLVGLGVWDEKDVSIKGWEAAVKSDSVYAEFYTADWGGSAKGLEKLIGKRITVIGRSDLEENAGKILGEAKKKDVTVLVPGDPLVATTHMHIILEARKKRIPVSVIHSSSAYTAIAETGLGIYNFGKTVTIAKPQKGYEPSSFYDAAADNRKSGLHTLILLDTGMDVKGGLEILTRIEAEKRKGLVLPETGIVAVSRIGSEEQQIVFGRVRDVIKKEMKPPAMVVIPGRLHFLEKEFLEGFK